MRKEGEQCKCSLGKLNILCFCGLIVFAPSTTLSERESEFLSGSVFADWHISSSSLLALLSHRFFSKLPYTFLLVTPAHRQHCTVTLKPYKKILASVCVLVQTVPKALKTGKFFILVEQLLFSSFLFLSIFFTFLLLQLFYSIA